jgi:hypothetical protein
MPDLQSIPWDAITGLVKALAALGWPIFAVVVVVLFLKEIKSLLRRFEGGEGFGVKIKLRKKLDRLAAATDSLPRRRLPRLLGRGGQSTVLAFEHAPTQWGGPAEADPKSRLMALETAVEDSLRWLLDTSGEPPEAGAAYGWPTLIARLRERGVVSSAILDAAEEFREARNLIVHGRGVGPDDVIRAIDIGERILEALPRPRPPKLPQEEIQQ